jgi:hypothetical protein
MWVRHLLVLGVFVLASSRLAQAQTRADSVAVLQALGTELRKDARTVVHRFVCYGPRDRCTSREGAAPDSLIRVFAEYAHAELVRDTEDSSQPCPWRWPDPPKPAGFRIRVAQPTIHGDTARVLILRRCATADRRGFALDVEYTLVRDTTGAWRLVNERTLRITRHTTPPGAEPGTVE